MFVSTKGRYALRMMLQLARNSDHSVRIKEVSEVEDISAKYLEQIMIVLKSEGFVESMRGPNGGYHLSKSPEEYTVGSIIRAMEGEMTLPCVHNMNSCARHDHCVTVKLWTKVDDAISDVIDNITLADMLKWEVESPSCISVHDPE